MSRTPSGTPDYRRADTPGPKRVFETSVGSAAADVCTRT
jgi:hypothetical protein